MLRGFIFFIGICGAMSQAQECELMNDAMADIAEMKERLDCMIERLMGCIEGTDVTTAPKEITTLKDITTTTVVTTEPPPPPTTTITEPPPPTTTTTEPPPPTTTTESPPPTTTTTEPPPPITTTTEPPPPTTTTTEPPPPTTMTTKPPPPTTTTTKAPPRRGDLGGVPAVPTRLRSCNHLMNAGHKTSGIYRITVSGFSRSVPVYCDMTTDGGGWMVFQRRVDGAVNFNRTYAEYAQGFGRLDGEFWLGNDLISALTNEAHHELRIDMRDWEDNEAYAKYSRFHVEGAAMAYLLKLGRYEGTSGDSFSYHDGSMFSTFDADNDDTGYRHCAKSHSGGWWFKSCMRSNLNGLYIRDGKYDSFPDGIEWSRFRGLKYSMMFTEMKMRPVV